GDGPGGMARGVLVTVGGPVGGVDCREPGVLGRGKRVSRDTEVVRGDRVMSDDPKADFYFRHRHRIEEWAALRQPASQLLHRALVEAVGGLSSDSRVPRVNVESSSRPGWTWVQLPVTGT